jgi:hypothetical protein
MVLYDYDFVCGGAELNLRGGDRLQQLATMCKSQAYPVIIERTPYDSSLGEARRVVVLNRLSALGIAMPPERVVIGVPLAIGLSGTEAVIIYRNLLRQTENSGYLGQQGQGSGFGAGQGSVIGGTLSPSGMGPTPPQ